MQSALAIFSGEIPRLDSVIVLRTAAAFSSRTAVSSTAAAGRTAAVKKRKYCVLCRSVLRFIVDIQELKLAFLQMRAWPGAFCLAGGGQRVEGKPTNSFAAAALLSLRTTPAKRS